MLGQYKSFGPGYEEVANMTICGKEYINIDYIEIQEKKKIKKEVKVACSC